MRLLTSTAVHVVVAAVLLGSSAGAQQRETRSGNTVSMVVSIYNAPATTRVYGTYTLAPADTVGGDVAVINGPVEISGTITGSLVAINADVRLVAGAHITRSLIVVGGSITRDEGVRVDGEIRSQAEVLLYQLQADRITVEDRTFDWHPTWSGPGMQDRGESFTDPLFLAARSYNRVEGLSASIGPRFRRPTDWGRVQVETFAVVRSASPVRWDRGTIGHDFKADLRLGVRNGLVVGARAFDVIDPIEQWQLRDPEAGLASFALRRDMRDWYGRHGGEGSVGLRLGEEVSLSLAGGSERWRSVGERRPFSLLRDSDPWRENPRIDEGKVELGTLRLRIDTREKTRSPWLGGWYVQADIERGTGRITRDPGPNLILAVEEEVNYTRGFLDARRYSMIAPSTELNLRLVMGGWLGGDPLPLQRRLSVGGPGSIDGYDFRRAPRDLDVFTCGGMADWTGRPTLCDRIAVAQIELRKNFEMHLMRDDRDQDWWRIGINTRGAWVLYADAGRGWSVDRGDAGIRHDTGIPPLSSFRTSIGGGIDFGAIGFYLAKATSTGSEPVNVIVRMGRRF